MRERKPPRTRLSETGAWIGPTQVRRCPVSLDLVRPHLADLQRTRSGETPFSDSSHLIWSAVAILSAVSHSIWSTMAILSVAHIQARSREIRSGTSANGKT
jgi:hypothetical protein